MRTGSAPPARSMVMPRSARVWPSSSTSAFGRPNLDPCPAASNTPATALRTIPKRMRWPNVARIYDYLLGGKDNFTVDRSHGQALLAHGDQVAMVRADLREPATVMRHPDVLALLDLTQPVAVVCAAVLHFVSDEDDPYRIVAEYRDRLARGSYLAISHGATATAEEDPDDVVGGVTSVYRQASAQLHVRSLAGIEGFFDGFDLIEPGVVWINEWRAGPAFRAVRLPPLLRGRAIR